MKDLSLERIIKNIKSKETSPKEVWEYFLKRIKTYNPHLNAFCHLNTTWLQENIQTIWAGAPLGIKDIFCEVWVPTTCSSLMLEWFIPPYDASVIKHLKDAWFSSIGKLNMDEFAMWSTTETSYYGNTLNPWGKNRIPGGSSGGSAVAVSAWLIPAALGTDTGWSIRQPASMCNVVWFKPSYGRLSRYGVIPMASSLDCPGMFTKTVKDAWLLYEVMNGSDEKENTSFEGKDLIDPKIWEKKDLKWVKIWVPQEYFEDGIESGVKEVIIQAIETCKNLWAEIVDISLPMTKYGVATYYILMPAEVSTNLWRMDGLRFGHSSDQVYKTMDEFYINNRTEGFWKEAQRRNILGSYVLSAWFYESYYKKACQVRTLIRQEFEQAFEQVDMILSPASPSVAWKLWEKSQDPIKMYLSDAYTIPASLAGLPALSVPAWFAYSEDEEKELLPVWLQIIGPQFADQKVLEFAHVFEQATWFGKQNPPWFEN